MQSVVVVVNGLRHLLHRLFSRRHQGIYSAYLCCHPCGKVQERILIPLWPCPCLAARDDLAELHRLGQHPRIEETPTGWLVRYGDGDSGSSRPTIAEAARGAVGMVRAWNTVMETARG